MVAIYYKEKDNKHFVLDLLLWLRLKQRVKSVQIRSFFCSAFFCIGIKYENMNTRKCGPGKLCIRTFFTYLKSFDCNAQNLLSERLVLLRAN